MQKNPRLGLLMVTLAATGYAFLPVIARSIYAVSSFEPTDIALWRFFFAVPIIWVIISLRDKNAEKRPYLPARWRLFALGLLYAGAALSAFFGLERVPASVYVVLFYTYPMMTAILAVVMGERLNRRAWFALILTLIGIILTVPDITDVQSIDWVGIGLALLNALLVAVYFIISSRVLRGVQAIARSSAWVMLGTLLCLCLMLPLVGLQIPQNSATWLNIIGLATVATAMPIFFINTGIQLIGASQAAIISTTEPVITMILSIFLLGEVVLSVQWVGALLIIAAVILLQLKPKQKSLPPVLNSN